MGEGTVQLVLQIVSSRPGSEDLWSSALDAPLSSQSPRGPPENQMATCLLSLFILSFEILLDPVDRIDSNVLYIYIYIYAHPSRTYVWIIFKGCTHCLNLKMTFQHLSRGGSDIYHWLKQRWCYFLLPFQMLHNWNTLQINWISSCFKYTHAHGFHTLTSVLSIFFNSQLMERSWVHVHVIANITWSKMTDPSPSQRDVWWFSFGHFHLLLFQIFRFSLLCGEKGIQ